MILCEIQNKEASAKGKSECFWKSSSKGGCYEHISRDEGRYKEISGRCRFKGHLL